VPPIIVIDTSVFVADALSRRRSNAPTRLLVLAATGHFNLVLCEEIRTELIAVLPRKAGWTETDVQARFGPIFDRASWLTPVPEEPHHRVAVQGDSADTAIVRVAEAIYVSNRPDLVALPAKFVVSVNTRHFPPGATYAGFVFVTPHYLLR
jgi:predicted nucleic acid-binding protein